MDGENRQKNRQIKFNETTFYKGLNATYGKIQVKLEFCLNFHYGFQDDSQGDWGFIGLGLFVGMDRMYRVSDIGHFLETLDGLESYYFSKNFIFEPTKMYFEKTDSRILGFLINLKVRRKCNNRNYSKDNDRVFDYERQEMHTNEVVLDRDESEGFLDFIWNDIDCIRFYKQSDEILFKNDINIKIGIEKKDVKEDSCSFALIMDYSEYGDFMPVAFNSRYIIFKDKRLIVKLPESKRELFMNLFNFKNEENIVYFKIGENEKKVFQKNFLDKYCHEFKVSMDSAVEKEIIANRLLTKAYFDVAPKGIVSKIEFCYADKIINPLDDVEIDKSYREIDGEKNAMAEMKFYGFKEYGKLFLLDDVEKIMFLLTDNLKVLKKICEVYYSEDFKKLHVRNLSDLDWGLRLSEDGSVIHMNINLENISDDELAELLDAIDKKKKYYRLRNGSIINLSNVESDKLMDLINSLDINKDNIKGGAFEVPLNRCLYIDNYLREKEVKNVEIDPKLGCMMTNLLNPEDNEVEMELDETLDEKLKGTLRNYQMTGVKWLKSMAGYSFGGILADDMGLGKTLQVLAFIASEKNASEKSDSEINASEINKKLPCLVVAPTSIIYNWKIESEKFTSGLRTLVITGTKDKRTLLIYQCNES